MTFEEVYEQIPGNGWLSRGEAELLWRVATACEGEILEVGCYQGRSTCLLASTGRPVYAVDPFADFDDSDKTGDKTEALFLENIHSRGLVNVQLFRMPIMLWETRPVGLAYLDGDHTYFGTIEQINVARLCKPSVIAIHDVNDSGDGLDIQRAAVRLLGPWQERVERLAVWEVK